MNPEIDYLAVSPALSPSLKATAKTKPFIYLLFIYLLSGSLPSRWAARSLSLYPALQVSRRDQSPNLCLYAQSRDSAVAPQVETLLFKQLYSGVILLQLPCYSVTVLQKTSVGFLSWPWGEGGVSVWGVWGGFPGNCRSTSLEPNYATGFG